VTAAGVLIAYILRRLTSVLVHIFSVLQIFDTVLHVTFCGHCYFPSDKR